MATAAAIDGLSALWSRGIADERAVKAGCRFDEGRAAWVVWWIERHCRLYEGEWAGEPLTLRGCHQCGDYGLSASIDFDAFDDAEPVVVERLRRHAACVEQGHAIDWPLDCVARLFGWVRFSEKWQREIRRFREAFVCVAKKNKKSPTAAAIALYLLAGDGEPGQKVFLCAKDGRQAREIVGKHCVEMMQRSPELSEECILNRNLLQITHAPTASICLPLSSSNERTRESKEGLNGSAIIDETHVVDREFIRRISRAGISRSEPLRLEVTTAGNDPDGYGKERFDYSRRVQLGEVEDQGLFVAIYAAPQDLADSELAADPVKWGRMANPAWGHTVDPEEYLEDYRKSCQKGIQELLDFKMYRLNIWQRSANPWLREGDWLRCRLQFSEEDLRGRSCWAGLDLSRTRDMSALVLCFPDDDGQYLLVPRFWLPEDRVEELAHLIPELRDWVRRGFLNVTPGGVTDFGYIRQCFREDAERFEIRSLAYDPRFAEETTQALSEGVSGADGKMIEEGLGIPRLVFAQNDENFAAPTQDFERLVVEGKLRHNGHPVLSWQAGHASVKVRPSKVKRVMKASKDDYRTVDGIIAAIMALAGAVRNDGDNWYSPGILTD